MKKLLFILFLFPLFAHAQTDSIETKLAKYKSLYADSLITEQEYSKLKESLLFPEPAPKRKIDVVLKKKFRGQIIAGSILSGAGLGTVIGGAIYKKTRVPYEKTDQVGNPIGYSINPNTYKTVYVGMFVIGSVTAVAGIVLDIIGIKNAVIYTKSKKTVSIGLAKENIGLALNF